MLWCLNCLRSRSRNLMAKTFSSETVCLGQLWGRCLHSDNLAEGFTFRSFAQDPGCRIFLDFRFADYMLSFGTAYHMVRTWTNMLNFGTAYHMARTWTNLWKAWRQWAYTWMWWEQGFWHTSPATTKITNTQWVDHINGWPGIKPQMAWDACWQLRWRNPLGRMLTTDYNQRQ